MAALRISRNVSSPSGVFVTRTAGIYGNGVSALLATKSLALRSLRSKLTVPGRNGNGLLLSLVSTQATASIGKPAAFHSG
jgi:hypothetical protein